MNPVLRWSIIFVLLTFAWYNWISKETIQYRVNLVQNEHVVTTTINDETYTAIKKRIDYGLSIYFDGEYFIETKNKVFICEVKSMDLINDDHILYFMVSLVIAIAFWLCTIKISDTTDYSFSDY